MMMNERDKETCASCGKEFAIYDSELDSKIPFGFPNGWTNKDEQNRVIFQSDPFAEEIYNDSTEMWLCSVCAYESYMDI